MSKGVKPGTPVPASGIYQTPGAKVTVDKGEKAPPTPRPGETWHIVPGTQTNPGPGAKKR